MVAPRLDSLSVSHHSRAPEKFIFARRPECKLYSFIGVGRRVFST